VTAGNVNLNKKTPPKGRVNVSTVHLDILGMVHDCKWIAGSYNLLQKKQGQKWPFNINNESIF
jgi:hypothetical protein